MHEEQRALGADTRTCSTQQTSENSKNGSESSLQSSPNIVHTDGQRESALDKVKCLLGKIIRIQLSDKRIIEGEFQVA